jgi:polyisoprenoid-binding protein YceI
MATSGHSAPGTVPSYQIDAAKSRFQVKAYASGLFAAMGHNPTIAIRGFSGEAWFRAQTPEQSSLRLAIDADSLEVTGDINEKDRAEMTRTMREEVLQTARYPDIRFDGSGREASQIAEGLYRVKLGGPLSLHGVERDVEVPCNVMVSDDGLRANGEFSIRQTDYHIKLVSVAGGTLKLKDELKFLFDIVAWRRREVAG